MNTALSAATVTDTRIAILVTEQALITWCDQPAASVVEVDYADICRRIRNGISDRMLTIRLEGIPLPEPSWKQHPEVRRQLEALKRLAA